MRRDDEMKDGALEKKKMSLLTQWPARITPPRSFYSRHTDSVIGYWVKSRGYPYFSEPKPKMDLPLYPARKLYARQASPMLCGAQQ